MYKRNLLYKMSTPTNQSSGSNIITQKKPQNKKVPLLTMRAPICQLASFIGSSSSSCSSEGDISSSSSPKLLSTSKPDITSSSPPDPSSDGLESVNITSLLEDYTSFTAPTTGGTRTKE